MMFEVLHERELAHVTGGMKWEHLPLSKNVEDRRTPVQRRRDDEWFRKQGERDKK